MERQERTKDVVKNALCGENKCAKRKARISQSHEGPVKFLCHYDVGGGRSKISPRTSDACVRSPLPPRVCESSLNHDADGNVST